MNNAWITLGAFGDIANTLPLVWHDYLRGNRPTFLIAQEFESLLDGVSYCDRLVWPSNYSESAKAADFAQNSGKFDNVYLCQCYGTSVDRGTDSYAKESWRLVERLHLWDTLPLVFDRRNEVRETHLLLKIGHRDKPKIAVATSGRSSPFPHRTALVELLRPLDAEFHFIDLDGFRADRFFDLIGLLEKCLALITIDSGLLHLAQAVPSLPVIALVTHSPDLWHGSPRRASHIFNCRYNEFPLRKGEIPTILRRLANGTKLNRLVHVYSDYDFRSDDAEYRYNVAKLSWNREYAISQWLPCPVHDSTLHRTAVSVGEPKPAPFLKDIINRGAEIATNDDVIVFTNDDTNFAPDFSVNILASAKAHGAIWGARRELPRITQPPTRNDMVKGYKHCGADVFAFTKEWWISHRDKVPDFILSFEMWDLVLKKLILITGGAEVDGLCAHQIHTSYWHMPEHRETAGNLWNRELGRRWIHEHGISWDDAFKV